MPVRMIGIVYRAYPNSTVDILYAITPGTSTHCGRGARRGRVGKRMPKKRSNAVNRSG